MTKVNCEIVDGLMPAEKVARIQSAEGKIEEVAVPEQNIQGGKLLAFEIGRSKGNVLLELPRERASGRWRIWVKESAIGG